MNIRDIVVFVVLFLSYSTQTVRAQFDMEAELPVDPKIKYGRLENGLTYYIRHNELPKERADFYIAQRVGSLQEEDNQAGLAHFLEHMAFNGTTNLPGKTLINYLETIGVKFGENLNAYTSFDQTVYNISNVPVSRDGIIDTCLLILHDWSGFLTLGEEEIEKERGVIREEMRTRNHARYRQIEGLLPQIMPGSRYAQRLPIGTEKVIMNFKPEELKAYYHKWYRPDLQGIIIVGDIDADEMEAKIKKLFADIPAPVDPAIREDYPVTDNNEPLVGLTTDKEATSTQIMVYFKTDEFPQDMKNTVQALIFDYFRRVSAMMMNSRFREIVEKPDPPFINASSYYSNFLVANTKDAWVTGGIAKEGEIKRTLSALVTETERVKKYGFTPSEYDRARINILKRYEDAYNEREKQNNERYAEEYVQHFTEGSYIPGIEIEYRLLKEIAPFIPLEFINEKLRDLIQDKNIVITLTGPEKEGLNYPSKEEIISWFNEARTAQLTPYADNFVTEPLMDNLPPAGKIISQSKDDLFGTINYELSNGAKVVIKPTVFKDNEINMQATSPGGSSHFPETQMANIKVFNTIMDIGGIGKFSNTELSKLLTGKTVSIHSNVSLLTENISGKSSVEDFETLLQLTYLSFTAPRKDEDAYLSYIERMRAILLSQEADPYTVLTDTLAQVLYENPERVSRLQASDLDQVNYDTIMTWYRDRFKDAGDFTFVFVGNINPEESRTLIEQYIASLPSTGRKESFIPINLSYKEGIYKTEFEKPVKNPKSTVINAYTGFIDYTPENRIKMTMLSQILKIIYTEKIREDEGGSYGVGVQGNIREYPEGQTLLQMSFDTNAEKMNELNEIINKEFRTLAETGPRQEDFSKVKEFMFKKQKENEQENSYWSSVITHYYRTGEDIYSNYEAILNNISPEDLRVFAFEILNQNNFKNIIMNGVRGD